MALHLFDHQFRIGNDAQVPGAVLDGPGQDGEEAGVFGVVVGLNAEELAELGHDAAAGVFNDGAVARGAGIAAGSAVAVGGEPLGGSGGGGGGGRVKEISVHRFSV